MNSTSVVELPKPSRTPETFKKQFFRTILFVNNNWGKPMNDLIHLFEGPHQRGEHTQAGLGEDGRRHLGLRMGSHALLRGDEVQICYPSFVPSVGRADRETVDGK